MSKVKYPLSGTPITTVDSLPKRRADDMLMISHPYVGISSHARYESNHITYSTLSSQLVADLSDRYSFGTMAWAESGDYALSDHHHAYYNKVAISSCIKAPAEYDPPCNNIIVSAATFVIDGVPTTIRAVLPDYKPISVYTPVGSITYVGWPKEYIAAHVIDPYADSFNGWIYMDGSTITCNVNENEFEEARQVFGSTKIDDTTEKFTVPKMTDYFFIDGDRTTLGHDANQSFDLVAHVHAARFKFNAQVQAEARFDLARAAPPDVRHERASRGNLDWFNISESGATYAKDGDPSTTYTVRIKDEALHKRNYNGTMHAICSPTSHPNMEVYGRVSFTGMVASGYRVGQAVDEFGENFPDLGDKYWPNHQYMVPMIYIGKKEKVERQEITI